ncbi:MAG: phosphotransferase [Phycisphaerales bacterium]|nr:phosphotransferase [Phycisphaerales bacterium]
MAQPDERARIGRHEIQEVLGHYDLGQIYQARSFERGSSKSPKARIKALEGEYLLKRCAPGQDDPDQIQQRHQIQLSLQEQGYPIAGLVRTMDDGSFVQRGSRVYELFHFIQGRRFNRSTSQAKAAGYEMARMHDHFIGWKGESPSSRGYHGKLGVMESMQRLPDRLSPDDPHRHRGMLAICRSLSKLFADAHDRIEALGYSQLSRTIVHGDWHPGNLIYEGNDVAAVLDFDSIRKEPRVSDLANGLLQHTMQIGDLDDVDHWPESLELPLLDAFRTGYDEGTFEPLEQNELAMIPWLMIEALVVESIAPIAERGRFGSIPGDRFLRHIEREIGWIRPRVQELVSRMAPDR